MQVDEAQRLIEICLEAGVNIFDTADVYSQGLSEEILSKALSKRLSQAIIATKAYGRMGQGLKDLGL